MLNTPYQHSLIVIILGGGFTQSTGSLIGIPSMVRTQRRYRWRDSALLRHLFRTKRSTRQPPLDFRLGQESGTPALASDPGKAFTSTYVIKLGLHQWHRTYQAHVMPYAQNSANKQLVVLHLLSRQGTGS